MTIKSLLIASAAALGAVSAAQAADAVVAAEPEPMEYVRVCDAYGAGFFYIPGTETCLAISGYVWYQVGVGNNGGDNYHGFDDGGWNKSVRGRLNIDARNETEWGTLRSFIRFQGTWANGGTSADAPVTLDQAWLQIGGLRMGYTETAWIDTVNGGNSSWGSHSDGGLYAPYHQTAVMQYSFSGGNGVYGTLSLEHDDGVNWMPDVVGVIGVGQAWGDVWARAAYDESAAGWAGSIGVQLNVPNMEGSSLRVIGYYASNDNAYAINNWGMANPAALLVPVTGDQWSILASYYHQFTPEFGASVGGQYISRDYNVAGGPSHWAAELNAVWTPVTNLEVRGEVVYSNIAAGTVDPASNATSGFLRVTRYF